MSKFCPPTPLVVCSCGFTGSHAELTYGMFCPVCGGCGGRDFVSIDISDAVNSVIKKDSPHVYFRRLSSQAAALKEISDKAKKTLDYGSPN